MVFVALYSVLLLAGFSISQFRDLSSYREPILASTKVCLSYIMLRVGLEFSLNKSRLRSYGWDFIVATLSASLPWIVCSLYFGYFFKITWKESWLLGIFAAPTSSGVLFSMISAAGMASGWFFEKVRILAIFDDLDTILMMIPLQILMTGFKVKLFAVLIMMLPLLYAAYRWLHVLKWPSGNYWTFGYGIIITLLSVVLKCTAGIHLEIILPAFAFGCMLHGPAGREKKQGRIHRIFDRIVKGLFMFFVGCSLPKLTPGAMDWEMIFFHVLVLTVLLNIGKCFPMICYRREASFRERMAVCAALFPRGEVGAGVLIVVLGYGASGIATTVAGLCLALNFVLTGIFILISMGLIDTGKLKQAVSL